jgi:hypothetical protein
MRFLGGNFATFAHFYVIFARFFVIFWILTTSKSCRFLDISCSFCLVFDTIAKNRIEKCTNIIIEMYHLRKTF